MPVRRTPLRPTLLALAMALTLPLAVQAAPVKQPAQALGDALNSLASQTGLRLLFATDLVSGKQAPALDGDYAPEQALRLLLANSGLEAVASPDGSYAIRALPQATPQQAAQQMEEVTVTARGEDPAGQVKGYVATRTRVGKSNDSLLESARSVSVITRDAMDDRGVQNVNEAVSYSAGVQAAPYGVDQRYDWTFLRGFSALFNTWRDGLLLTGSDFAVPRINSYGLERVEVLRGPASVLYGQSNPGGLISLTTKRPTAEPWHEVGIGGGNFDNRHVFADLSDKLDADGTWRYRLTAYGRNAENHVEHSQDDSYYVAPAFTWSPSSDTSLTFLATLQSDRGNGLYSATPSAHFTNTAALFGLTLDKIPASRNAGNPDFEGFDRDYAALGYALDHRFNDTWSFTQNVRFESTRLDYRRAQLAGVLPPGILGAEVLLTQNAIINDEDLQSWLFDQHLDGNWKNGALDYTLTVGLDLSWTDARQRELTSDPDPMAATIIGMLPVPTTPLYSHVLNGFNANPSYPVIAMPTTQTRDLALKSRRSGVYVQNRFKLEDRWIFNLAGRQDWVVGDTDNYMTGAPREIQNDSAFSGQGSVMYLLDGGIAPYASYSTGFNPVLEVDASGNPFDPEEARQWEAGIKWQPDSAVLLSLAAYDLSKENVISADAFGVKSQTGEVRSRGIEAEGTVSLDNGLKLIASYTRNNAEIVADKNYPNRIGTAPQQVPENQAAAWLDYTQQDGVLKGLGAGVGARYIGSMHYLEDDLVAFSPAGVAIDLKGYTLFDAALRYQIQQWSLSLNVQNLTDKEVLVWCTSQICQYNQPRTFVATARYRW